MGSKMKPAEGALTLAEIKEFAGLSASTQRYVRRSLDVGFGRDDALELWSRDVVEAASIRAQARVYSRLPEIRSMVPDDSGLDSVEPFLMPLVTVIGLQLGGMLRGAVMTEVVFTLPGLGMMITNAVQTREYIVVQAGIMITALLFILVNFLVDQTYSILDPRLRRHGR